MADVYRAREAFSYIDHTGVPRVVTPGQLMASDHPDFKGKERMFEPVEVAAARSSGVEQATAAPGELRAVSTPRSDRGRRRAGKTSAKPEESKPDIAQVNDRADDTEEGSDA